jgi:hypothetical protein
MEGIMNSDEAGTAHENLFRVRVLDFPIIDMKNQTIVTAPE